MQCNNRTTCTIHVTISNRFIHELQTMLHTHECPAKLLHIT